MSPVVTLRVESRIKLRVVLILLYFGTNVKRKGPSIRVRTQDITMDVRVPTEI